MSTILSTVPSTRARLQSALAAAPRVGELTTEQKNVLLRSMADAIESQAVSILAANAMDLPGCGLEGAMRDRLRLTSERVRAMAEGVREVAALPDPVGETLAEWQRPNGLRIRKVRVPLGVIGIIYESRPNVTVDAVALALKTGNAVVLRGGKEAAHSNQ